MKETKQEPTRAQYEAAKALVLAEHDRWLEDDQTGTRLEFHDTNLAGAYLAGANLAGAYLEGAYLEGAYLEGAYLAGAYLAGANLTEAPDF